MGCRLGGRLTLSLFMLSTLACIIPPREKPINPRLAFTTGKSFLDSAATLALKGSIEFNDGRTVQSGSFEMFLAGRDSLAFRIEGPLGIDVFRMIVMDTTAYLLANKDEGWVALGPNERAEVAEYGIDYISPFETGMVIFPQYYVDSFTPHGENALTLKSRSHDYQCAIENAGKRFVILAGEYEIVSEYSRPYAFEDGFYPSMIKLSTPDAKWNIKIHIGNIKVNPIIPLKIWVKG